MKISDLYEQMPNKRRTIKDLSNYVKIKSGNSPNYSLFLGAGASVTSGINSGAQLVEEWRKEIYELLSGTAFTDIKTAKDYLIEKHSTWYEPSHEYSSLFQKKFDLPSQRRRFVEGQVDSKLPSIGYSYMVSLFQSGYIDTVFTTNFDDLINEAFYQFSRERPTLCAHDSSIKGVSVNSSRPKIIKVHGDYLFDSIKSTLNETESLEANTRDKLIEFTKKYGLIFMGYAGNDRSIIDVINYLLRQDEYLGNGIYWCFRKDDEINPDLLKIIKKEKVYFVEIEGFDQALAEMHYHIIGEGLSLEANFKSTKRDTILSSFTTDAFQLASNKYISDDLNQLKTHTNKVDISNLINELSGENYSNSKDFTEVDFRNLLTLDTLLKNKKYEESEKEALKLFATCTFDNMKKAYLSRLIDIYQQQNQYDKALEKMDKILEMDEFSVGNNLRKISLIKTPIYKIEFSASLLEKFKYSSEVRNQYASEALIFLKSKSYNNSIKLEEVIEKLNESIKIDPSLDNRAWNLLRKVMEKMKNIKDGNKDGNKDYKDGIVKIIEKMSEMNPIHISTLNMRMRLYILDVDLDNILSLLEELDSIYLTSSKKKQSELIALMIEINRKLTSFKCRDKALKCSNELMSKYANSFDEPSEAIFFLYKAEHAIVYDRDLEKAKRLIREAINLEDSPEYAQPMLNILLYEKPDEESALLLLEKSKSHVDEYIYQMMKSQLLVDTGKYSEANEAIEKSLVAGLDYENYLISHSFINLREGAYQKALNLIATGIERISVSSGKDALIINRELASKMMKRKVNKVDLQNIYGRDKKGPASIAAHLLLDEEVPARRLMDEVINNDFSYYFTFQKWPVIPDNYLERYDISHASSNIKIA